MKQARQIAILGSTGSIGTQTLDIISEYPQLFRAHTLTANTRWEELAAQARQYLPQRVVIADERYYRSLKDALAGFPVEVLAGMDAVTDSVKDSDLDMVVTAMVGYSGLAPTISAIEAGKTIALANKETLVVGGELVERLLQGSGSKIIPVDSEHSAIFQCLEGEHAEQAQKIILTASGGPFRTKSIDELESVTVADALHHPNWDMGAKVTIDSASMMNKGFEMIEAHWLFGCPPDKIEVVVHPQSIVHSMVQFADGSIKAQLGVPDMHLPIRYALGYPQRLETKQSPLEIGQYATLTFEKPDMQKFPLLEYAFDAIRLGGTMPCILNAANEIAVASFLRSEIRFVDMPRVAAQTMNQVRFSTCTDYDHLVETNREARSVAEEIVKQISKR
ncbi:MAG: 1-deoxy-D-xylulose-5-phosphate reductoisomerase [Prevotella sp.]|nr:1-deoxy-D-xylulose-5-phosphate reductoisomerase [Bacteroides sp.]MCM1366345.1 1-deoxy-D-xylulose-5-phosphate reductoisomerase [Prevotella sp.]MCM1436297.1 1-deoxy-D-xylulose-5-phosphate reductoisomerase [Prevotella sp.]